MKTKCHKTMIRFKNLYISIKKHKERTVNLNFRDLCKIYYHFLHRLKILGKISFLKILYKKRILIYFIFFCLGLQL